MTFFIPRWERYRDRKPTGPVEIDWNNAYAQSLVDFISPVNGSVISHVTGQKFAATTTTSFGFDDNEYVMGGQYVVDIPNYTDEFTVAVEAKLPTADGAEYVFRRVDGTQNFYIAYVIFNANIKAKIIGNTFIDSGISSVAGQKYSALLCKKDGNPGILTTYSNNQFSEVTSRNNNTNDTTQIYLAYDSDVPVYFAATFNKALSGADYYDFLSAPYQVLQPRRKIFVLSSGAGTAYDVSFDSAINNIVQPTRSADLYRNIELSKDISVSSTRLSDITAQLVYSNAISVYGDGNNVSDRDYDSSIITDAQLDAGANILASLNLTDILQDESTASNLVECSSNLSSLAAVLESAAKDSNASLDLDNIVDIIESIGNTILVSLDLLNNISQEGDILKDSNAAIALISSVADQHTATKESNVSIILSELLDTYGTLGNIIDASISLAKTLDLVEGVSRDITVTTDFISESGIVGESARDILANFVLQNNALSAQQASNIVDAVVDYVVNTSDSSEASMALTVDGSLTLNTVLTDSSDVVLYSVTSVAPNIRTLFITKQNRTLKIFRDGEII